MSSRKVNELSDFNPLQAIAATSRLVLVMIQQHSIITIFRSMIESTLQGGPDDFCFEDMSTSFSKRSTKSGRRGLSVRLYKNVKLILSQFL